MISMKDFSEIVNSDVMIEIIVIVSVAESFEYKLTIVDSIIVNLYQNS